MANHCVNQAESAPLGVIMLDTQFPRIVGDIGNPNSFEFPVLYEVVAGASPDRIVLHPDTNLIEPFIEAGRRLIEKGSRLLATSCGFLALFHNELTSAFTVPVLSSSLLQIHMARSIVKKGQKVGVITANKGALTSRHFAAIGVDKNSIQIVGMEHTEEFSSVFVGGKQTLDENKCRKEMEEVAIDLIRSHPTVGAIVLECTNMPPYSQVVREATGGLPVFDMITMINYAYATMGKNMSAH